MSGVPPPLPFEAFFRFSYNPVRVGSAHGGRDTHAPAWYKSWTAGEHITAGTRRVLFITFHTIWKRMQYYIILNNIRKISHVVIKKLQQKTSCNYDTIFFRKILKHFELILFIYFIILI